MAYSEEDREQSKPGIQSHEQQLESTVFVRIPGSTVHIIDKQQRIQVGCGVFGIKLCRRKHDRVLAVSAFVGDDIEWPLRKDEKVVKLDGCHYFFVVREDSLSAGDGHLFDADQLNCGFLVTVNGCDQVDRVLEEYSAFLLGGYGFLSTIAAACWTALAPNMEDYGGRVARMIAGKSGQLIGRIDRLERGNELLNHLRTSVGQKTADSSEALRTMERVKSLTKTSENVATGMHSRVPGFLTTSILDLNPGKKLFSLLPGKETIIASLDGLDNTCHAILVAESKVTSCIRHQLRVV